MLADTAEARAEEVSEGKELVSTVFEKLDYVRSPVIRYWDDVLQKEATNLAYPVRYAVPPPCFIFPLHLVYHPRITRYVSLGAALANKS